MASMMGASTGGLLGGGSGSSGEETISYEQGPITAPVGPGAGQSLFGYKQVAKGDNG